MSDQTPRAETADAARSPPSFWRRASYASPSRRGASREFPRAWALSILGFFQRGFSDVGEFVSDTFASIGELRRLRENYDELSAKLERYTNMERGLADLREENKRLKEQLGFSRDIAYQRIAARIVAKDPENLYSTIMIDKGFGDGIRKNMPVIAFQDGIGRLGRKDSRGRRRHEQDRAHLRLDVFRRIALLAGGSRTEGLVGGQGSPDDPLLMRFVKKQAKDEIQFGDLVVTTGYESVYPLGRRHRTGQEGQGARLPDFDRYRARPRPGFLPPRVRLRGEAAGRGRRGLAMIRSVVLSTILLVACALAQSAWFGGIAVLGVTPDLGLVVLIWLSYMNGLVAGPISGFLSGFAEDFLSASPLGFHAFIKTAVAAAASLLHGSFYIDKLLLPIILGFAGTIAKALAAGALFLLFGSKVHAYSLLERTLWIEAAYNGLLAPLVFLLLGP